MPALEQINVSTQQFITRSVRFQVSLPAVAVGALTVLFVALNLWWIWLFRHGQPLDIDEAGYLVMAFSDFHALAQHGLSGFLHTVEAPNAQAPLTSAAAALLFWVFGPHQIVAFATTILAGAGTILATYLLGSTLGSRRIGLVSSILIACCPATIFFSRDFQFSLPATFVTTMALLSIVRSDGFRMPGWSAAFGFFCGLMPLTRTMTLAFLPGMAAAAAVFAMTRLDNQHKHQRLAMLAMACVLGLFIALTWLWPNGKYVFHYLLSFGYGNHASEFGAHADILSVERWREMAGLLTHYVHLPYFLFLFTGAFLGLILTARLFLVHGALSSFRMLVSSNGAPIAIFACEAVLALLSSQNLGDGFMVPVLPGAIILSVWLLDRAVRHGTGRV